MKYLLRIISVLIVKFLQKRYKSISIKNRYNQSTPVLAKLQLIQSVLYFFKTQFNAWGYFHPDCVWSKQDEEYFRKLFPQKDDFEELDIVVWHNPEAVTYYHNEIYRLNQGRATRYSEEIKRQLIEWKRWN